MNTFGIIIGILREGLIYSIVSFGVYITYKILDFPDMTVDGSFPLGMSLTAIMIINGVNPIFCLLISFIVGLIAGVITGIIHVKLGIRDLLSGIIVMTGLYSINLRIAGKANLPIFHHPNIFRNPFVDFNFLFIDNHIISLFILIFIVILCKILLDNYLSTKSGYLLKSVGDNEILVTSLAKDKGNVKILGLAIANGFVAFAGSIYAQDRGFFEISSGTGTLVIAVANVIIGMQIIKKFKFLKSTTSVIIGAIIYRACISIAIAFGMEARDLKLITALLLLIILSLHFEKNKKIVKKV